MSYEYHCRLAIFARILRATEHSISYYLMGLIKVLLEGVGEIRHNLNPTLATGLLAPFVVLLVWRLLHRIRMRIGHS